MATPHVAGAAAIVLKGLKVISDPDKSPAHIKNILKSSAIDLGKTEFYGAGLLNVYSAACSALDQAQGPDLQPFPKTVRLEGSDSTGSFILKNIGDGTSISIDSITVKNESTAGFVSVMPPTSGSTGIDGMTVQVSLNIDDKKTGETHFALIEITYGGTGKKEYANVSYKYIGNVYVVVLDPDFLIHPDSSDIIAMTTTDYNNGYDYSIDGLLAGKYIIGASTDRDDNGYIFESNEAYGFYPEPGYETIVNLSSGIHLIGVDFILADDQL
jgi:hypothetical protein